MAVNTARSIVDSFDDVLAGFDDMLVVASEVERYNMPGSPAEQQRANDKVWRPMPYIPAVYDGFDQSSNFGDITRLFVPVSVGIHKAVPVKWGPKDGRDEQSIAKYFSDAALSLASIVNQSVYTT